MVTPEVLPYAQVDDSRNFYFPPTATHARVIERFLQIVHDENERQNVVLLKGPSGVGKSSLMAFLQENCSFLSDQFDPVRLTEPSGAISLARYKNKKPLLTAALDFSLPWNGYFRPADPFYGLLNLRDQLAKNPNFYSAIFDFACIQYLYRSGQLTPERIRALYPIEHRALIFALADLAAKTAEAHFEDEVFNAISQFYGKAFTPYMMRRRVSRETIKNLRLLSDRFALLDALPRLLAEEVESFSNNGDENARIVLFLDSLERYYPHTHDHRDDPEKFEQFWLNRLIRELISNNRVTLVLASRYSLPYRTSWRKSRQERIAATFKLASPEKADVSRFVSQIEYSPTAPPVLTNMLTAQNGRLQTLDLALFSEYVRMQENEAAHGEALQKRAGSEAFLRLFLSGLPREMTQSILALSAPRVFDAAIYLHLDDRLYFRGSAKLFEKIVDFAFIERPKSDGEKSYRISARLRAQMQRYARSLVREANMALIDFFKARSEKGDECASVELIYHQNALQWENGVLNWILEMGRALDEKRFGYARILLSVLPDLSIESSYWKARTHQTHGDYYLAQGKPGEASVWYKRALGRYKQFLKGNPNDRETLRGRSACLQSLAQAAFQENDLNGSVKYCNLATQLCDHVLRVDSSFLAAYSNKASALSLLAGLHLAQRKPEKSLEKLNAALEAAKAALNRAPEYVPALKIKAGVYRELAKASEEIGDDAEAERLLCAVIQTHGDFLEKERTSETAALGISIFLELSRVRLILGKLEEAFEAAQEALRRSDQAIETGTTKTTFYLFRVRALSLLVKIETKRGALASVPNYLADALEISDALVNMEPENEQALSARSAILTLKAHYAQFSGEPDEAPANRRLAEKDALLALELKPQDAVYLHNAGAIQFAYGHFSNDSNPPNPDKFESANRLLDDAIHFAPQDYPFMLNRVYAQISSHGAAISVADFQAVKEDAIEHLIPKEKNRHSRKELTALRVLHLLNQGALRKSVADYTEANAAFAEALALLSDLQPGAHFPVHAGILKAAASLEYGEMLCELSRREKAKELFENALESLENARLNADESWLGDLLSGIAYTFLAKILIGKTQFSQAVKFCETAVTHFDQASAQQGCGPFARSNKAWAMVRQAEALFWLADFRSALKLGSESVALLQEALAEAPQDLGTLSSLGLARLSQGQIYAKLDQKNEAEKAFRKAIEVFDQSLALYKDHPLILNHKISVLLALGDLCAPEDDGEALEYYNAAISQLQTLTAITPNDLDVLNNKGQATIRLGDLRRSLGETSEAVENYESAVEVFGRALRQAPGHDVILNHRANAFQKSAEALYSLGEKEKAAVHLKKADQIYAEILAESEFEIITLFNRGVCAFKAGLYATWDDLPAEAIVHFQLASESLTSAKNAAPLNPIINQKLADASLAVALHQLEVDNVADAKRNLELAVEFYNIAENWKDDDRLMLFNRATAFLKLGEIEAREEQGGRALWSFSQALEGYDEAARLDPQDDQTRRQKGETLATTGDTQYSFAQYSEAIESYKAAVKEYDAAIEVRDALLSQYYKAIALANLAGACAAVSKTDDAIVYYQQAVVVYKRVVARQHDYANAEFNLGLTLAHIGNLFDAMQESGEAGKYFREAISVYNRRLARHPKEISTLLNKGQAQTSLAELLKSGSMLSEAQKNYRAAIESFQTIIAVAPDELGAYYNEGVAFSGLALALLDNLGAEAAIETYKNALAAYDLLLERDAGYVDAIYNKGVACSTIGQLHLRLGDNDAAHRRLSEGLRILGQALTLSPHDVQIREAGMQTKSLLQQLDA